MTLAKAHFAGCGKVLPEFGSVVTFSQPEGTDYDYVVPADWQGKYGAALGGQRLKFRTFGNLDGPVVVVLGGISADRFVARENTETKGWWGDIAHHGGPIDSERHCIIGFDFVPNEANEVFDLCPEDFAHLIKQALETINIYNIEAFIGSSFGGMIGLAFARCYPKALNKLAVLCAANEPHPMAQAWRLVQRKTIELALANGCPEEGLNLARQLAITTYRSPEEFIERFDNDLTSDRSVEHYLTSQGKKYADKVNPYRYLSLSAAIDRHFETPQAIKTPTLLMGALTDRLVPFSQVSELQSQLGGPADFIAIQSLYGHDAFLKETKFIGQHLSTFLAE